MPINKYSLKRITRDEGNNLQQNKGQQKYKV